MTRKMHVIPLNGSWTCACGRRSIEVAYAVTEKFFCKNWKLYEDRMCASCLRWFRRNSPSPHTATAHRAASDDARAD